MRQLFNLNQKQKENSNKQNTRALISNTFQFQSEQKSDNLHTQNKKRKTNQRQQFQGQFYFYALFLASLAFFGMGNLKRIKNRARCYICVNLIIAAVFTVRMRLCMHMSVCLCLCVYHSTAYLPLICFLDYKTKFSCDLDKRQKYSYKKSRNKTKFNICIFHCP